MHSSLILEHFEEVDGDDIIMCHGKEYFKFPRYTPEKSGMVEILVRSRSPYKKLIAERIFIPILYYDYDYDEWMYLGQTKMTPSELQLVGWRWL